MEISSVDTVFLRQKLYEVIKACEDFDIRGTKSAMADLKKKTWPDAIKDIIDEISIDLTRGDFEKVLAVVKKQRKSMD